jgi:hypothetical protein
MKYSFREFLELDELTQIALGKTEVNEELNQKLKDKKMMELEKALKSHDWFFSYADDQRSWKKGKKESEDIRKLVDLIGDDGMSLYKQYGKKAGVSFREGVENRKKAFTQPNEYEAFLQMKMKEWGIESLDQLQPEPLKRFWKECDLEWKGNDEIETNIPEQKSMFREMDSVVRKGLGYGDGDRAVGEKSLTAGSFCDAGNLYPQHLVPKWIPPSPQRKRGWQDK